MKLIVDSLASHHHRYYAEVRNNDADHQKEFADSSGTKRSKFS